LGGAGSLILIGQDAAMPFDRDGRNIRFTVSPSPVASILIHH
jgi:hypothetical protein